MYRNKENLLSYLVSQGIADGGYNIPAGPNGSSSPNFMDVAMDQWDGLNDKIQCVSVKDYGATGNGVTDDTEAIQLAINYAILTKTPLLFTGDAEYLISHTLTADNSLRIKGNATLVVNSAMGLSTVVTWGNNTAYAFMEITGASNSMNASTQNFAIEGLSFKNNDTTHQCIGIHLNGAFNRIKIYSCNAYNLKNSMVLAGTNGVYSAVGANAQGTCLSSINHFSGSGCYAEYGGMGQNPALFHVLVPASCDIYNNKVRYCIGDAIRVDGGSYNTIPNGLLGSRNINIHHNNIEGWGNTDIAIQVTKSYNVQVSNNNFVGLNDAGYLSGDNSVDIFNCHNVSINDNTIVNGGGLFAGHADLGNGTASNLIGTRNVVINGNAITNCKNNPVFIGGDSGVNTDKSTKNITISNNMIRWDKVSACANAAIYSFLCNYINVFGNTFDGYLNVVKTYYDQYYNICDNTIINIQQYVDNTGNDGTTTATHSWLNNKAIGISGSISGFEVLNPTGNVQASLVSEIKYNLDVTNGAGVSTTLSTDTSGKKVFKFNAVAGGNPLTIGITIPKGTTLLSLDSIYNAAAGSNTASGCFNRSSILLFYGTASTSAVTAISSGTLYDNGYNSSLAVTVVNNGSGNYTLTFAISCSITKDYDELMVALDYNCIGNI